MKSSLFLLLLLFVASFAVAQTPEWIDVTQRQQAYSDRVYRTGFYSQAKAKETEAVFTRLKDAAKTELIESIQVSIQSTTTLKQEETKKGFNESYTSESTSLAEGDLIDLNILTYFDRKKKTAYAFAYVRTEKLINYHLAIVASAAENAGQMLSANTNLITSGQLKEAIEDIFKVRTEIRKIEKSRSILMALGKNDPKDLRTDDNIKFRAEVNSQLEKVLADPRLTANNLSSYFSFYFYESMPKEKKTMVVYPFVYEGYSFTSDLSGFLSKAVTDGLSEKGDVQVVTNPKADLQMSGTFYEAGDNIVVTAVLSDATWQKKVLRSAQGKLSKATLTKEGVDFLPVEIQKVNFMKAIKLEVTPSKYSLRLFDTVNAVVKLKAFIPNGTKQDPANEIPIRFGIQQSRNSTTVYTNDKGGIDYLINSVRSPLKTQALVATIDAQAYLRMDTSNAEYKKLIKNVLIPRAVVQLTISGNSVKARSNEVNLGQATKMQVLQSGLVDALTKTGFRFTQGNDADYTLVIDSQTKEGGSLEGLYFSYLDASVSLVDNRTQKEVFSNLYQGIKASGINFDNAGQKAYTVGLKKIKEDLVRYFE